MPDNSYKILFRFYSAVLEQWTVETVWAHCIGFTEQKAAKEELARILEEMSLEYFQDEIPYYGPGRPVYRTFVLGCDVKKTDELKRKYYKAK